MAFGSMNSGDDSPMADINVTPLVDVMLVLLIVFMITMPVMTHSVPLELPTASEAQKPEAQPKDPIRISINADGKYHLAEGSALEFKELESRLKQIGTENKDAVIAIAADKNVPFERVEDALSAVRDAGLNKVGFVTQERQD